MFIKVTTSGGHRYARLVESFRNEDGQPRQRTVATLGRIDECGGQLDALLGGLLRAKGRPANSADAPSCDSSPRLRWGMSGPWMPCGTSWGLMAWALSFAVPASPILWNMPCA
jgi:hypothetical protein